MESDDDSYESGPVGEVAVDTVARLGQRIMAIILGNLCTLAICLLFYLNYVLFESYLLVFLYAFLASEALWDTKQNLVTWLREMSDPDRPISIREEINNRFMSVNRNNSNRTQSWVEVSSQTWVIVGVYGIGMATYPQLCIYTTIFSIFGLLVAFVLDDKILFVFRLHRWFLDDDTFVALILIVLLVFAGIFVASSFSLLVLRDARTAADLLQSSIETNLFGAEWAQDTLQELSTQGKNVMHKYVDVLEDEYLKNSTWAPILRWTISYADNLTGTFSEQEQNDFKFEAAGLFEKWQTMQNTSWWDVPQVPDIKELSSQAKAFFTSNQELLGKMGDLSGHLKENIFAAVAMGFSVTFLLVDFGVRIVFFITFLFILLSSKETVLHEFLSGFMEHEYEDPSSSQLLLLEVQLRSVIEAVFMLPVKMSVLNALATLLLFWMFGMKLMFFASSLSLLITIFPIITPFWICLPWIIVYYVNNTWGIGWCLFVFSINYLLFYIVNMWVLAGFGNKFHRTNSNGAYSSLGSQDEFDLNTSETDTSDGKDSFNDMLLVGKREYITGLSVFFGLTAFGAKGALLGPVVVCLALVMYNVIRDQQQHVYRDSYQTVNNAALLATPVSGRFKVRSPTIGGTTIKKELRSRNRRASYHSGVRVKKRRESTMSSRSRLSPAIEEEEEKFDAVSAIADNLKEETVNKTVVDKAVKSNHPSEQPIARMHRSGSTIKELAKSSANLLDYFSTAMSPGIQGKHGDAEKKSGVSRGMEEEIRQKLKYMKNLLNEELITEENYEKEKQKLLDAYSTRRSRSLHRRSDLSDMKSPSGRLTRRSKSSESIVP